MITQKTRQFKLKKTDHRTEANTVQYIPITNLPVQSKVNLKNGMTQIFIDRTLKVVEGAGQKISRISFLQVCTLHFSFCSLPK